MRTLGKWVCALNIFKAHKRNPDTPHQNGGEMDREEVWFVGRHSGTYIDVLLRRYSNRDSLTVTMAYENRIRRRRWPSEGYR